MMSCLFFKVLERMQTSIVLKDPHTLSTLSEEKNNSTFNNIRFNNLKLYTKVNVF